jgi:hypothetical protein
MVTTESGKTMRIFAIMIVALLLDACTALPQGSSFDAMAEHIHWLLDSDSQSTAVYRASVQETRLARSKATITATRTRAEQPLVAPVPSLAGVPMAAHASVPTLDAEANCRMAETLDANQKADICLLSENSAREQLVGRWTEFPSADRLLCTRSSTAGGGGTYTELLTCLEMEMFAENQGLKSQFVTRDQEDTTAGHATQPPRDGSR